jgi:uncharacterized RDD family membrane protein YckC
VAKRPRPSEPESRDVAIGLIAVSTRLALLPARALARMPFSGPALRALERRGRATSLEGQRRLREAADDALAGPLPEQAAKALVEQRVVERMAAQAASVPEDEAIERIAERVLASPAFERLVAEALETEAVERGIEQVASSPAVRTAMMRQTATLSDEVGDSLRRHGRRLDERAETGARRWLRREAAEPHSPYGGLASRGAAFVADLALTSVIASVGGAILGLVTSLVGELRPTWLVGTLLACGWLLVVTAYFSLFWSTVGQTPAMRVLGLRVLGRDGTPPSVGRSLLRIAGLLLGLVPLFAGVLAVLFTDRRRGLQDAFGDTVVVYEGARVPAEAHLGEEAAEELRPLGSAP